MSKTATALFIKLAMTFAFTLLSFTAFAYMMLGFSNPLSWILIVAFIVTAANYVVGDLLVVPWLGKNLAAVGDGLMGALAAYLIAFFFAGFQVTLGGLILFAVLITIGELYFHSYLLRSNKVAPNSE